MDKKIYSLIGQKVAYFLRDQLLTYQSSLKQGEKEEKATISLDDFMEIYLHKKNELNENSKGEQNLNLGKELQVIENEYFGNPWVKDSNSKVRMSEQNINELIGLVSESIEKLRIGDLGYEVYNAVGFMRRLLSELEKSIKKQPDSFEKNEKLTKINRYCEFLGILKRYWPKGKVPELSYTIENGDVAFSIYYHDNISCMNIVIFEIERDGTVKVDKDIPKEQPILQQQFSPDSKKVAEVLAALEGRTMFNIEKIEEL